MGVTSVQQQQHLNLFHSLWWGGDSILSITGNANCFVQHTTSPYVQYLSLALQAKGCRKTGWKWQQSVLVFLLRQIQRTALGVCESLRTSVAVPNYPHKPNPQQWLKPGMFLLVLVSVFPHQSPGGWKRPLSTEVLPPDTQDTSTMRMFWNSKF